MSTKRNAAYFEERIRKDHPLIYADLQAGRFASVRAAAVAAGMVKPRTALLELKNSFRKAPLDQRRAFIDWLKANYGKAAANKAMPTIPATAASAISLPRGPSIRADGHLEPWARIRIEEILRARNLRAGVVMAEMGSTTLDASLGMALRQDYRLKKLPPKVLDAWIADWSRKLALP